MPFVDDVPPQQPAAAQRGFVDEVPKAAPAQAAPKRGFVDEQPAQSPLQAVTQEPHLQAANEGLQGGFAEGQRRIAESVRHPMDAMMNVEQTLARGSSTLIEDLSQGKGFHSLGHALWNSINPDEGNDSVDRIVAKIEPTVRKMGSGLLMKENSTANKFMSHIAAQSIVDPVSWFPVANVAKRTIMATKLAQELATASKAAGVAIPGVKHAVKVGNKVRDVYHEHVGEEFHKTLTERPELENDLEYHAKTGRMRIENKHRSYIEDELGVPDRELLKRNDKALRGVKATAEKGYELPEEVRQRYLQEPWRYGSQEMRRQAEELGYHPTEADAHWKHAPEDLLHYDLRKDYQYIGDLSKKMSNSPAFASAGGRYGNKTMAAELRRNGNWDGLESDQRERVAARLQMGRDFIRKRRVDRETEQFLKKYGGWKGSGPIDVSKLSHSATQVWAASPLRIFNKLGKDSILASMLPHLINNMGTLTFWKGGLPALVKSAVYMIKPPTAEMIARQKGIGMHTSYGQDFEKIIGARIPGVRNWLGMSQHMLDRGEVAMRQAILDQLDAKYGASKNVLDEYKKAQEVMGAMGDYHNVSALVSFFQALGAPFASFAGITAKAANNVIRSQHAYRYAMPLRAQQNMDADQDTFHGLQIPNPASKFAQIATGEALTSPSVTGPLVSALGNVFLDKAGVPKIENFWDSMAEHAQSYAGPVAGNVPGFFDMPYGTPDKDPGTFDPINGLVHLFLGDYWKNPSSEKPDMRIQRDADRASGL